MHLWRYAVITHLHEALKARVLASNCATKDLRAKLTAQYERWWNIDIVRFQSKGQFPRYAGRYVRRPADCSAPLPQDNGSGSLILDEGLAGETHRDNSLFQRGVRGVAGRASARPLPACHSQFWTVSEIGFCFSYTSRRRPTHYIQAIAVAHFREEGRQ
jgi:hypothetical protein